MAFADDQEHGERRALCPGSFDPVTRGHLDVMLRARTLFDLLYVAVIDNPAKRPLFSVVERVRLVEAALDEEGIEAKGRPRGGIEVVSFTGLTVDLAERLGARWIVRGLRSGSEADYELAMARTNRTASSSRVETLLLPARAATSFVASRFVRELAAGGADVSEFVSPAVAAALKARLRTP